MNRPVMPTPKAQERPNPLGAKRVFWILAYLGFILFLLELALRLQQQLGPLSDLEFEHIKTGQESQTLNHVNVPGKLIVPDSEHGIQELKGETLIYEYDENSIRINRLQPDYPPSVIPFKVVFIGDSFTEGYMSEHTIPQHAWEYFQESGLKDIPMKFINAGVMSYSPLIYIPYVKKIIPLLKPDFVVMLIDETDMGDDYIYYRDLTDRDENGHVVAVRASPHHYEYVQGFVRAKKIPFYLVRWLMKMYYRHIKLPYLRRVFIRDKGAKDIFVYSKDTDIHAREKYAKEISFFKDNLGELVTTLIDLMGNPSKILFVHNSHLEHLKPDESGHLWNSFVSDAVGEVTARFGVFFYNPKDDLNQAFGERPEDFYFKHDMHFNYEGLRIYGNFVAGKLYPLVSPLTRPLDPQVSERS